MLLANNWRYRQAGNNSRMRMKVQGRLIQARFIEIHQVFTKKSRLSCIRFQVRYLDFVAYRNAHNYLNGTTVKPEN